MRTLLEICVDTYESAVAAIDGGADRIELCAALSEGGLTPSVGLLRKVKQYLTEREQATAVPIYCMIRCRRGSDFCYDQAEMEIMLTDLALLRENGADGFVFGALDEAGTVHRAHCEQVVRAAREGTNRCLPLTFHRAIDCTAEEKLKDNLQTILELGFSTVLTSGLKPTAVQGLTTIVRMQLIVEKLYETTKQHLQIMPGSGVSTHNVVAILKSSGCQAIHGSASVSKPVSSGQGTIPMGHSNVDALPIKVCSKAIVAELQQLLEATFNRI
ncbi:copper homeostasis protein cutC homolog [Anopheles albimanus]|uniref:Copper homeostasis protein cutC homolog n=1 Tax=Anopheles albimanus TaxID=7167 RepID=A0A182FKW9_ANOAL|nr:copper homeostasis protein cutC homolog [Anopheles albimanus]